MRLSESACEAQSVTAKASVNVRRSVAVLTLVQIALSYCLRLFGHGKASFIAFCTRPTAGRCRSLVCLLKYSQTTLDDWPSVDLEAGSMGAWPLRRRHPCRFASRSPLERALPYLLDP